MVMVVRSHPALFAIAVTLLAATPLLPLVFEEETSAGEPSSVASAELARAESDAANEEARPETPVPGAPSARRAVATPAEGRAYAGQLLDARGNPLPGARLGWVTGDDAQWTAPRKRSRASEAVLAPAITTVTDAEGYFAFASLPEEEEGGPILLDAGRRFLFGTGWRIADDGTRHRVLLTARAVDVTVTVVDEEGEPVRAAAVSHASSPSLIRGLPFRFLSDSSDVVTISRQHADGEGRCALSAVPSYPGALLGAARQGDHAMEIRPSI